MTHGTDSSTRLDDHDHEHDPRDPVYTDDARDEAYHAEDETERDTDTELDAAARRDATDTVDDADARDDELTSDETSAAAENRYGEDTRTADDQASEQSDLTEARDHDEVRDDEVTRGGDAFGVNEATRERDAFQADQADYEATHTHDSNRTDGEEIAVPAAPIESNPPTAVAVAPVNAVDQHDDAGAYEAGTDRDAVEATTDRDADETGADRDAGAYEGGTDRDAVEAVNADSATGTVYGTGQEADDQRADNGPIAPGVTSEAQPVHDEMKPGSVEPAPIAAFFKDADAEGIRGRWRELQLRFIDDPESVTGEAERLVEEAVASLTAALNQAKQDLGDWRDGQSNDTERLRAAVRSYRDFLDRLLGL